MLFTEPNLRRSHRPSGRLGGRERCSPSRTSHLLVTCLPQLHGHSGEKWQIKSWSVIHIRWAKKTNDGVVVVWYVSAELLFMCFAIYLCYCTRSAPSNYREVRYISWAIYNETIVSAAFYICRSASLIFWENMLTTAYLHLLILYNFIWGLGDIF